MDCLMESIVDFVRVRQLNIALLGVLTALYFAYKYWHTIYKNNDIDNEDYRDDSRTRSRSRSASRSRYRSDAKQRRGRKSHRRCPDCSNLCNYDE